MLPRFQLNFLQNIFRLSLVSNHRTHSFPNRAEVPAHKRFETRTVTRQSHLNQRLVLNGPQDGIDCGGLHSDCGDPFRHGIVWT